MKVKKAEFSKNSANPGGGVFDRSGYQGRTGCRKRQGTEAVDNGPAVSSAVVDIEVCRVLLDYGVVVIDKIVADVIDVGVVDVGWQTCTDAALRSGLRVGRDEAETTAESAAEDCSNCYAVQFFIFGQVTDHKLVHGSVSVVVEIHVVGGYSPRSFRSMAMHIAEPMPARSRFCQQLFNYMNNS